MSEDYYNLYVNEEANNMDSMRQKNQIQKNYWDTRSDITKLIKQRPDDLFEILISNANSNPHLCLHILSQLQDTFHTYGWQHPFSVRIMHAVSEIHSLIENNIHSSIIHEFKKYASFPEIVIDLLQSVSSGFYSSPGFQPVMPDGTFHDYNTKSLNHRYANCLISHNIVGFMLNVINLYHSKEMLYRLMFTIRHCIRSVSVDSIKQCFQNPETIITMQKTLRKVDMVTFRFIDFINEGFVELICALFKDGSKYDTQNETIICRNLLTQLGNDNFCDADPKDLLIHIIQNEVKAKTSINLKRSFESFKETNYGQCRSIHNSHERRF